jgi:glycogen synthase
MNVVYMTREYPPYVYGGAGVHLEYLSREMARLATVEVKCYGDQAEPEENPAVRGYPYETPDFRSSPDRVKGALMALHTCLHFNAQPIQADIVHCHTWYSMAGGVIAKLSYGVPLVCTVHSLEPLRPWKREQLGRGYDVSTWIERTALELADAVIAVSGNDRREIVSRYAIDPAQVHVVPNGIDPDEYRRTDATDGLARHGVPTDRPYVLFLGRIARQKGIVHFLEAARRLDPGVAIVLCAAAPDTPDVLADTEAALARLRAARPAGAAPVVWVDAMVDRRTAIQLYSHAAVFCCPSVYEPFGIINLEAMACETPVVASAVGGIPEVVVPGETGLLVPLTARSASDAEPANPEAFAAGLADALSRLLADAGERRRMGRRGRERVEAEFGWAAVARRTLAIYEKVRAAAQPRVDIRVPRREGAGGEGAAG